MSLNLVSPGVKVREVDLTVGRIDPVFDQVGGFVGPFAKGPVGVPVLIETEQDLLATFGKHSETEGLQEQVLRLLEPKTTKTIISMIPLGSSQQETQVVGQMN